MAYNAYVVRPTLIVFFKKPSGLGFQNYSEQVAVFIKYTAAERAV
jgi:hypothetical protein